MTHGDSVFNADGGVIEPDNRENGAGGSVIAFGAGVIQSSFSDINSGGSDCIADCRVSITGGAVMAPDNCVFNTPFYKP